MQSPLGFFHGLLEQLEKQSGNKPLILDLRGNPGGSPLSIVNLLCAVGDDSVIDAMGMREYEISKWPESFSTTSGKTFSVSDLSPVANSDLQVVVKGWKSTSNYDNTRIVSTLNLLDRGKLTPGSCKNMRLHDSQKLKWRILTDGSEFSATELFLSLVNTASGQFESYGRRSRGGSGSPTTILLPNTKIKITISQARQLDLTTHQYVVDKIGVIPTHEVSADSVEDFEYELNAILANQPLPHKPQTIVRKALSDI